MTQATGKNKPQVVSQEQTMGNAYALYGEKQTMSLASGDMTERIPASFVCDTAVARLHELLSSVY